MLLKKQRQRKQADESANGFLEKSEIPIPKKEHQKSKYKNQKT